MLEMKMWVLVLLVWTNNGVHQRVLGPYTEARCHEASDVYEARQPGETRGAVTRRLAICVPAPELP